jgi:hypothetical protein
MTVATSMIVILGAVVYTASRIDGDERTADQRLDGALAAYLAVGFTDSGSAEMAFGLM